SFQGEAAFCRYLSKATAVIVQLAGLRFSNSCSLSKLGRHRAVADASRSASGYRCLLLDGLKRGFPIYIVGSSEQRSLSGPLVGFLKSGSKGGLRQIVGSVSTHKRHSPTRRSLFSIGCSDSIGNRVWTVPGRSGSSVCPFNNDSDLFSPRSDPSRHASISGKNKTSPQGLLGGYHSQSRSRSSSR